MAVTIKHAKTDNIADWTQSDLDAQIAAGNYPPGTVLADIVLPSDWNNSHTVTGLGTMATQDANAVSITGGTMSGVAITGYIPTTQKGVANGVATLDSGGQVPLSQLPPLGDLNYQGTWNASTNSPTLTSSTGTKGYYYVVSVAGSTNLNGITDWQVNDWAVFNGSVWQKIDNTDAVNSVNGKTGTVVLTYGDITSGVVPVVNGGTGVTTSSGANSVVLRDANGNITTNCLFEGFTSQANGSLITLTASSVQNWVITGSGGQTIKLPDATTLPSGALFTFNNNQSSGTIVVQNNSGTTVDTLQSGSFSTVVLLNNSTTAGSWDKHDQAPANVSWSTNTFDYSGSITSATWNGNAIALNRGGTNANLTAVNGGAVYSTGTALAISAAGTSGQVLTSSGAGAPTWTTPTTGTVTNVTGTAPVVSSGGTTPAISMAAATTSVNGYLTSTDWTTFNGKQAALVSGTNIKTVNSTSLLGSGDVSVGVLTVTGTSPVVSSGGANPAISMAAASSTVNGYLTSTDWTTFNNKGSGTVTSVAALTLGTTGTDLTSTVATGTTTPVITLNVPTASASNRGALSSADWTTFNNKGSGSVTSASVVSANGFAGTVATATTTPAITISTSITGVLKGNSTAISAATSGTDYSAGTSALATGIVKSTTTTGALSIAVSGTDFCAATSGSSVLKGSSGNTTAATAGTDYVAPGTATNFTAQQYFGTSTLTDGATISWAASTAQVATVTIAGNRTMAAPSGLVSGAFYALNVIQDSTGSRTMTWNTVFKWTGGTAPTLSTAANAKDFFVFRSDGTNLYEQGRSLGVA